MGMESFGGYVPVPEADNEKKIDADEIKNVERENMHLESGVTPEPQEKMETLQREYADVLQEYEDLDHRSSLNEEEQARKAGLLERKKGIILAFKKAYGYEDEHEKVYPEGISSDQDETIRALNSYLGVNLPIFSEDVRTTEVGGKKYVNMGGEDGLENSIVLLEKQEHFVEKVFAAQDAIAKLSEEDMGVLLESARLQRDAFVKRETSVANDYISKCLAPTLVLGPEKPVEPVSLDEGAFQYIRTINGERMDEKKREEFQTNKGSLSFDYAAMAIDILLVEKLAREKGLI